MGDMLLAYVAGMFSGGTVSVLLYALVIAAAEKEKSMYERDTMVPDNPPKK